MKDPQATVASTYKQKEQVGSMHTHSGFFRTLEIDMLDVFRYPEALPDILNGSLQAVVIHNVLDDNLLDDIVPRLERHDPPFLKTWFPEIFRSWFYGRNLDLTIPELSEYFSEAHAFRKHLRALFPEDLDFTTHVTKVLSTLSGGWPFEAPVGPNSEQQYMFATLRAHLEGGFIPPHFDNDKPIRAPYYHLHRLIELPVISYILAFSMAEAGGALEVYNLRHDQVTPSMLDENNTVIPSVLDQIDSVQFRLQPGTMIVVDSGRYLHRLSPVVGSTKRWNACSFMAKSRTPDTVYCWG